MPRNKGIALTIGLNAVDPTRYSGWSGELIACEADAADMAHIARSCGFAVSTLLTKDATQANVAAEVIKAAGTLVVGDIFMLSYSGHGGQLPDLNSDEVDGLDETWCLYDREYVDDEINVLLSQFAAGVRVLVFSDSCHSGSVTKMAFYRSINGAPGIAASPAETRYRFMPREIIQRVYRDHKDMYDAILTDPKLRKSEAKVKASVLLFAGCQDNQLSADGPFNGLFTSNLLQVWRNGKFKGSYRDFHRAIGRRMPPQQTPALTRTGVSSLDYEQQQPFTI